MALEAYENAETWNHTRESPARSDSRVKCPLCPDLKASCVVREARVTL